MTKEKIEKYLMKCREKQRQGKPLSRLQKLLLNISFDSKYKTDWIEYNTGGNGDNLFRPNQTIHKFIVIERKKEGKRIIAFRSLGLMPDRIGRMGEMIPKFIRQKLHNQPCCMLGTNAEIMEIDHKMGIKSYIDPQDPRLKNPLFYQSMGKASNDAKRHICIECIRTKKRFDARKLGFNNGWYFGNEELDVEDGKKISYDKNPCYGCYQFDPWLFRQNTIFKKQLI